MEPILLLDHGPRSRHEQHRALPASAGAIVLIGASSSAPRSRVAAPDSPWAAVTTDIHTDAWFVGCRSAWVGDSSETHQRSGRRRRADLIDMKG